MHNLKKRLIKSKENRLKNKNKNWLKKTKKIGHQMIIIIILIMENVGNAKH
jgi:hypothetical protein